METNRDVRAETAKVNPVVNYLAEGNQSGRPFGDQLPPALAVASKAPTTSAAGQPAKPTDPPGVAPATNDELSFTIVKNSQEPLTKTYGIGSDGNKRRCARRVCRSDRPAG